MATREPFGLGLHEETGEEMGRKDSEEQERADRQKKKKNGKRKGLDH